MPSISSYVGGVTDRLKHNEDGYFYQFDAPYMLAYYLCEVFENKENTLKLSRNARRNALEYHDIVKNTKKLWKFITI